MKRWKFWALLVVGFWITVSVAIARVSLPVWGMSVPGANSEGAQQPSQVVEGSADSIQLAQASRSSASNSSTSFASVVEQSERLPGLFDIYRHSATESVYLALSPQQLNQNYLCLMTLSSGLGEVLYRGRSLGDFLFQFQRLQDTIQLVVPNIYFRAELGDPQQRSIEDSFSDSTLMTMPIVATDSATGTVLIDINELVLQRQDLANVSSQVELNLGRSYDINPDTSYIRDVQAFPHNVEIDTLYSFSGANVPFVLESIPDARSFNLTVHYSLSELPDRSSYQPRLADERVGYFINAYQNLSRMNQARPFVRYIWRWNLQPQQPDAALSPPQEPIVFWIENTVPQAYRAAIREGVLLWNKAFEAAGFEQAIEVKQMPDDADWDPADVRYNTIRWTSSLYPFGAVAMPRVNPLTGEILDADVVIDAGFVRDIRDTSGFLAQQQSQAGLQEQNQYQNFFSQLCHPILGQSYRRWWSYQNQQQRGSASTLSFLGQNLGQNFDATDAAQTMANEDHCYGMGLSSHGSMAALMMTTLDNALPSGDEMEQLVQQFLVHLTAHEVGHALGLRHNFRASTMLAPDQLNDRSITNERGITGSVMDYTPVNLAPPGVEQGDYFSKTVGDYDVWAIAYGYTPTDAIIPIQEQPELEAIARRAPELGITYATDEDAYDRLNPSANQWDLSSDPLQYARWQMDNAKAVWEKLPNRYPIAGESYSELRDRFDVVYGYFFGQAMNITRYIGGQVFNRNRRGDPGGRQPFEQVALEKQRRALQVLNDYVFAPDAFDFPSNLINQLAPSRWWHWGSSPTIRRLDYPVYDSILWLQNLTLAQILSSERLSRIRDAALSYDSTEILSLPELFETLKTQIWTELLADGAPEISSLRRGLQRQHLKILSNMALRNTDALDEATNLMDAIVAFETLEAPEDARVLARYQLRQLGETLEDSLRRYDDDLDTLTLAHMQDALDRINKVIAAPLRSR